MHGDMLICMKRTTMNIDTGLLEELKRLALLHKMSQTGLLKLLLSEGIKNLKNKKSLESASFKLPVAGEGGLREGLNLNERSRLWDLLDEQRNKLDVGS